MKLRNIWKDPVWSAVIAAIIISGLTYFLGFWPDFLRLPAILEHAKSIWHAINSTIEIKLWLLSGLSLMALMTAIRLISWLMKKAGFFDNSIITWKLYLEDDFYDIKWRWRYANTNGTILDQDVHAFCLNCDCQLRVRNNRAYRAVDGFEFYCEHCRQAVGDFDETYLSLVTKVKMFVQRKIRNGEWEKVVQIK